jgi:hypothetical protein
MKIDPEEFYQESPILLVKRGSCPFVVKTRNAEDVGFKAVVVYDHSDEEVDSIIMSDNGAGGNLVIPTVLIGKASGEILSNFLYEQQDPSIGGEKPEEVILKITFEMRQHDIVDLKFWTSADNRDFYNFEEEFFGAVQTLDRDHIAFMPRFVLWQNSTCKREGCGEKIKNCLAGGRYCAPDPDGNGPLDGRHSVTEALRQLCIFKETYDLPDYDLYFNYTTSFNGL